MTPARLIYFITIIPGESGGAAVYWGEKCRKESPHSLDYIEMALVACDSAELGRALSELVVDLVAAPVQETAVYAVVDDRGVGFSKALMWLNISKPRGGFLLQQWWRSDRSPYSQVHVFGYEDQVVHTAICLCEQATNDKIDRGVNRANRVMSHDHVDLIGK